MLIDFTVENYRSIKEPVTLSMIASSRKKVPAGKESKRRNIKSDDEIAAPFSVEERQLNLLPVIGIFGANASGKSNVIRALDELLAFIFMSSNPKYGIPTRWFTPFRLNGRSTKEPTRFEIRVIRDKTIFIYSLVLNKTRILHEKLEYIPAASQKAQTRLLFGITWQEDQETYSVKNGKDLGNGYREIQESLRETELFLSFLIFHLDVKITRPLAVWLADVEELATEALEYKWATEGLVSSEPEPGESVTRILRRFDTGITQIEIEKPKADNDEQDEEIKVWVWHEAEGKPVRWPIQEESTGTQRLFSLSCKMLRAIRTGGLVLMDELGSNIHPNIT